VVPAIVEIDKYGVELKSLGCMDRHQVRFRNPALFEFKDPKIRAAEYLYIRFDFESLEDARSSELYALDPIGE